MASAKRMYPKEEFCRRGDAIYDAHIRPVLKARDNGKFVAIDIESGAYQVHSDELRACDLLCARKPTAQIWIVRVGSRAVHHLRFVARIAQS